LIHPRLFAALVVVDPVIGPTAFQFGHALIYASSMHPDLWNSREEAECFFRSAKPLKRWDPRVIDLALGYGLRATPTLSYPEPGRITLRTTKACEAWSYARSAFDRLRSMFDPLPSTYLSERGRIKYPDGDESFFDSHPFYCPESKYVWEALPQIRQSVLYIFPDSTP
jgi:hypothetical protein